MKFGLFASLFIAATLMVGCSGVKTPKAKMVDHDDDHDLPAVDQTIIRMKQDYIKNCYMPVAKREPPENSCQTELFQMLERRYHSDYSQKQVDMAANDLFFKDVDKELRKLAKSDVEVRRSLRNGTFESINDMIAYYRDAYKFETK
ncbi:MAG: hypothetical protein MJY78_02975 [Fibrobacter sp.]|nr:hypothetical protein [Fibrobacter sp.]